MAGIRYLTVRQRALNAFKARLETIQQPEYNTTVLPSSIKWTQEIPDRIPETPALYLRVGQAEIFFRSTHHVFERVPVEVWLALNRSENIDMEFNLYLGDVQRAIGMNFLYDDSNPTCRREFYVTERANKADYWTARADQVVGVVGYDIEFWRHLTDPRLYDDQDVLVPVDE